MMSVLSSVVALMCTSMWAHHATADFTIRCEHDPNNATNTRCTASGQSGRPDLVQGDIIFDEDAPRNAIISRLHIWPNGIVPYVFHQDFNQEEKERVVLGFRSLEAGACVRFIPWTGAGAFLLITKEPKCFATAGFTPNEAGFVRLNLESPGCMFPLGLMQHEMLHVLGLVHEQSRPDRDKYVEILWDNIAEGEKHNFNAFSSKEVTTFDIPYNYMSVMHYTNNEFSKSPNLATIVSKLNPAMVMGQREGATEEDMEKLRKLYFCSNVANASPFQQLGPNVSPFDQHAG